MSTPVREPLQPLPYSPYGRSQGMPGIDPNAPMQTMQTQAKPASTSAQPAGGYAQLSPYTATNNLRGTQIAGGAADRAKTVNPYSPQTAQAGVYAGNAASNVQTGAAGQARAMALKDLTGLGGPDRGALAESTFNRLRESTEPAFQKELQGVGQKAAALGRLGAGMTTSDLGDVVQRREQGLAYEAGRLSDDAASRTLDDRLSVTDARLRGSGQFTDEDLGRSGAYQSLSDLTYGQGRGLRDEERLDDDRTFDRDLTMRDELRGERSFQNDMSQQATNDMIRQRTLEEMLLNGEWGRDMDMNNLLLSYGHGG